MEDTSYEKHSDEEHDGFVEALDTVQLTPPISFDWDNWTLMMDANNIMDVLNEY